MYCSNCGSQMPDGARFCHECGAEQGPPRPLPPHPPGRGSSNAIWIVLALAGVVVIALAVALPLIFLRSGGGATDDTIAVSTTVTVPSTTGSENASSTTPTEPATTTSEAATTTTATSAADIPGDSAGTWAETNVSGLDQQVGQVAVSDDALLFQVGGTGKVGLYAYLFDSGKTVQLPTAADAVGQVGIDGTLAVWREANGTNPITDAHIYVMRLPDGPKVEVATGADVAYPQVAPGMVSWVESKPWPTEPDAWTEYTIKGVSADADGRPIGAEFTVVEPGSAIGSTLGDSGWNYSLSEGFLAWEQQTEAGAIGAGSYVMDLAGMEPWRIDRNAWRPSLYRNRVVFTLDGVSYADFAGTGKTMDATADFATAAPTYAAYFRPKPSADGTAWEVVAKGYTGTHEQVLLGDAGSPPWLLPPVAASAHRIAFAFDGTLHLFSWH